ncbi:Autophagy-related protein 13 [Pleurostoma richardsiae]|uniref:Autophagy-related protein 13 n=1 Tax=Pleurostoma richardsiae TaxID=41990 RepID=A0AA38RM05_9PEZI|nr:Autophagy-related protein 13 [Pleurostoma richardsiae]
MHQQSRHPPRVSSPASGPQTNPTRTNNSREGLGAHARTTSEAIRQEMTGTQAVREGAPAGPTKDSVKKLDQIIQNFYYKAAVVILQSRIRTTPSSGSRRPDGRKTNKWFQLDTDDIEDFKDELRTWRTCGSFENRPPPMIVETYLDVSRLSSSQTVVIVDENGKRWDVLEALNSSESSSDGGSPRLQRRNTEVVLERWRVELKCTPDSDIEDFGAILPTVYKKSIVFFRSLFVATRFLPAWKFSQQVMTKGTHPSLEVKCRILTSEPETHGYDPLRQPLSDGRDVVMDYVFGDLEVPIGRPSRDESDISSESGETRGVGHELTYVVNAGERRARPPSFTTNYRILIDIKALFTQR